MIFNLIRASELMASSSGPVDADYPHVGIHPKWIPTFAGGSSLREAQADADRRIMGWATDYGIALSKALIEKRSRPLIVMPKKIGKVKKTMTMKMKMNKAMMDSRLDTYRARRCAQDALDSLHAGIKTIVDGFIPSPSPMLKKNDVCPMTYDDPPMALTWYTYQPPRITVKVPIPSGVHEIFMTYDNSRHGIDKPILVYEHSDYIGISNDDDQYLGFYWNQLDWDKEEELKWQGLLLGSTFVQIHGQEQKDHWERLEAIGRERSRASRAVDPDSGLPSRKRRTMDSDFGTGDSDGSDDGSDNGRDYAGVLGDGDDDVAATGLPDPGSAGAELMADEALRLAMREDTSDSEGIPKGLAQMASMGRQYYDDETE